jgi:hypothetical protein
MADYQDILNMYAQDAAGIVTDYIHPEAVLAPKQAELADATKRNLNQINALTSADGYRAAAARHNGGPGELTPELQMDMVTLTPTQMYAKYGDAAAGILAASNQGAMDYAGDATAGRSQEQMLGDVTTDVVAAPVTMATGLGGLAADALGWGAKHATRLLDQAINGQSTGLTKAGEDLNDTGQAIGLGLTKATDAINTVVQATQSDGLNRHRQAKAALSEVLSEENSRKYERDIKNGDSKVSAILHQIGRGVLDGTKTELSDGTVFSADAANAVGSLLAVGPVTKVLQKGVDAVAEPVLKAGFRTGLIDASTKVPEKLAKIGEHALTAASVGAMEAGGAYQQTASTVLNMDHAELKSKSPAYNQLIKQGMTPDEARNELASKAGLIGAAVAGPTGAAAGIIVSNFEGKVLHAFLKGDTSLARSMLAEAVEEGSQGATGQLGQNLGIQQTADPNQELGDQVGEQAAIGAIHGPGAVITTGGPGAAIRLAGQGARVTMRGVAATGSAVGDLAKAAGSAAKSVASPLVAPIIARADAIIAANKKASPVSEENVSQAVADANNAAPDLEANLAQAIDQTGATTEAKQQAHSYLKDVLSSIRFDPAELDDPNMPAQVKDTLTGSTDRFDAIKRLSDLVNSSEDGSQEQLSAATYLNDMLAKNRDLTDHTLAGAIDELPADHPAMPMLNQAVQTLVDIQHTPKVADALAKAESIAQSANDNGAIRPVTKDELATTEGQQRIRNTIAVAEHSPLNGNLEANDQILRHAEDGNVHLTTAQRVALQASNALIAAQRARLDENKRLGLTTNHDIVAEDILTKESGQDVKGPSLAKHVKRIVDAARAGQKDVTAAYLTNLTQFAQHMQNKVGAMNEALAKGANSDKKTVTFDALQPNHTFRPSTLGAYVNPFTPGGVKHAQTIGSEAEILARVANDLVKIFPDLGVKPVEQVKLNPVLTSGTAQEVAKSFREGRARSNVDAAKAAEPKSTTEPAETGQPKGGDQSVEAKVELKSTKDLKLYHGSDQKLSLDNVDTDRLATKQNKKGRTYGGFYGTTNVDEAKGYAGENGHVHEIKIKDGSKTLETDRDVTRLSQEDRDAYRKQGVDVLIGKDPRGRTEHVILNKSAIESFSRQKAEKSTSAAKAEAVGAVEIPFDTTRFDNATNKAVKEKGVARVINYAGRMIVLKVVNGVQVPFYLSTGSGGKADVLSGKWYPFFGIGEDGWINKLSGKEINNYYGSETLAHAAAELDSTLGDLRNDESIPKVGATGAHIDAINKGLNPASNQEKNTLEQVKANIADLVQKVDPNTVQETQSEPIVAKTVDERYPDLLDGSQVKTAFSLPTEAKTRTLDKASPLAAIREALSSAKSLQDFIGSKLKNDFTPEMAKEYERYLEMADSIKAVLAGRLEAALKLERGGHTVAEYLLDPKLEVITQTKKGDRVVTYSAKTLFPKSNLKALNLVENQNGKLGYNEHLLEGATLAALQWLLVSDRFQTELDNEDVAQILEIPKDRFQDTIFDKNGDPVLRTFTDKKGNERSYAVSLTSELNKGLGLVEAKRSLAGMVKSFWGLDENRKAGIGQIEGVPEAIASELLEALKKVGGLDQTTHTITEANGLPEGTVKKLHVFVPFTKKNVEDTRPDSLANPEHPLHAFPDAIEHAVLTQPEPTNFIGEVPTQIAEAQLRNSQVTLTDGQKQALEFEQKQPHFTNVPVARMFTVGLGMDNVVDLFAAGDLESQKLNVMDQKSKDGLNQTFRSGYVSLVKLLTELENKAGVAGTAIDQLPIYYRYAFTRVNRMQMLGLNNPQASKLMREAVLPTRSTLDLSDQTGEHFSAFTLALAQALGIKVHQVSRETATKEVLGMLNTGPLLEAGKMLQEWLKGEPRPLTKDEVKLLKEGLGKNNTPVALHAVMEYARYLNGDAKSLKAFTTSLYVEADGVTNGPGNTMQLLTPGRFTAKWIKTMRKVGLFVGADGMTMNDHRQFGDANDLYTETTNALIRIMADFRLRLRNEAPTVKAKNDADYAIEHLDRLGRLMNEFMSDVMFDGKEFSFARGIAKNPLTITLYGSGANGIAGNIADELMGSIYARLSDAIQKQEETGVSFAEGLFPELAGDPAAAKAKLTQFFSDLGALKRDVVIREYGRLDVSRGKPIQVRNFNAEDFSLQANELDNLKQNVRMLFVDQLREAITTTIGEDLLGAQNRSQRTDGTLDVLRKAIQVQSIVLEHAFKKAVQAKLEEKSKDPNWAKDDFLTRGELEEIYKQLADVAPLIHTEAQRYFLAGSQSADIGNDNFHFGSSFEDRMRTPAYVEGASDVGVGGIPGTIIGFGDGLMMQILSTMEGAPDRTLKVFDGIHLPLDAIAEGSQKANEAVFGSWMGNPLEAVSKSYTAFLEALTVKDMSDAERAALSKALGAGRSIVLDEKSIEARLKELGPKIAYQAMTIEARHRAMARIGLSVDQMAAVGSPFVRGGAISLENMSDKEMEAKLNELAREEMIKLQKEDLKAKQEATPVEPKTEKTGPEDIAPELEKVGRKLKSGARVVSYTALKKLVRALNIPADQRAVLGDIVRTLTTKEYKIVYGTPEEVQAYADERGIDLQSDPSDEGKILNGFILPSQQTIFLHNPSSETLVHELIHAATFATLQAHYAGEDIGRPETINVLKS